jgi:nucleotide-binding universal stress UspA family protein
MAALFERIALASTFSPRFLPLLAEARRFAASFGTDFSVIHAGPKEEKSEQLFQNAFRDFNFEVPPPVIWAEGASPDEAITAALREMRADLLILGALEKEMAGRQFVGNVARALMRKAGCSLLFLTKPRIEEAPIRTVVIAAGRGPETRRCIELARTFTRAQPAPRLHLVSVLSVFAQAQAAHQGEAPLREAEELRLRELATSAQGEVEVDTRCIESTTGFAASEFVQTIGADLLIMPSGPAGAEAPFPQGMDWIFDTIPTNLLVVRTQDQR